MRAKVALTYIVKDDTEKDIFEKSLKSFTPYFDGLFVIINGLSGNHSQIHKLVKKYKGVSKSVNATTNPELYSPKKDGSGLFFSNFAGARKLTFDLVPNDYDYIAWADTDDLLAGGEDIRKVVDQAKANNLDMVFCTYFYSVNFNDKGQIANVLITHERERFIKKSSYKWTSRLHEVCVPLIPTPKIAQYSFDPNLNQNLVWVHTATLDKALVTLDRNVSILEIQAEEEKFKDPRTIFYLAKTYFDIGGDDNLKKSDEYLDKYISMSGWDAEIGNAYEYKGLIAQKNNMQDKAKEYYLQSIKTYPRHHIPHLRLADIYFKENRDDLASFYLDIVDKILGEYKSQATIGNPHEIKVLFFTLKYIQAMKKGDIKSAYNFAVERHKYQPDGLLEEAAYHQEKEFIASAFVNLATYYIKNGMHKRLLMLLEHAPHEFREEKFLMDLAQKLPTKKYGDDEIVYYASSGFKHFEMWNGDNLKVGIGGSESAVIYLSEEWVKSGKKVIVFCDTPNTTLINGVLYVPYYLINWADEFSTIIFWRSPHLLDIPIKAKNIFYDAHDIESMDNWNKARVDKVSKVFFKSKWHRKNLPQIPESKAVVISNGVTR